MDNFPQDFDSLAKQGGNPASGGYPYQIRGRDLMANFVWAALDTDSALIDQVPGQGGHTQRRLKIAPGNAANQILYWDGSNYVPLAAPPSTGTYVLGAISGALTWIDTEECP